MLKDLTEPLPGEMDELALRLLGELSAAVQTAGQQLGDPDWLTFSAEVDWWGSRTVAPGYRIVGSVEGPSLHVEVNLAHGSRAECRLDVQCATEADRPDVIVVDDDGVVVLDAFLWDLRPTLSSAVKHRATAVAESLLADLVAQVTPPAPRPA